MPQAHDHKETGPYIDGSQTPYLIPDDVAYSMFLRMLLPRGTSAEAIKRRRAHVKHILRTANALSQITEHDVTRHDAARHSAQREVSPPSEADIIAMFGFIAVYEARLLSPDFTLKRMQDTLPEISVIVTTMPQHLGPELASKIDRYVKHQFKKQIKIIY